MGPVTNIKSWTYDISAIPYSSYTNNTNRVAASNTAVLKEIASTVSFKNSNSYRRRMGVNGANALSVYEVSKWYFFGHKARDLYKQQFPADKIEKAFTGWFLRIPAAGFIDTIATWVDKTTQNMHYFSIALHDNQQIVIDGVLHTFNEGDVCWFNIKCVYEIPTTTTEQLWACILVAEY